MGSAGSSEVRLASGACLHIAVPSEADAAAIVAYTDMVSGESDFHPFGPGELWTTVADQAAFLASLPKNPTTLMLKGTLDDRVVSMCSAQRPRSPRTRHRCELGLSVGKAHWRSGIGRAMTMAMLQLAREAGITKVNLQVRENNLPALRLYESFGFEREGVTARATLFEGRYFANILMGLSL
jgi:RimJ/RimL family protein N-acetyltransferase